MMGLIVRHRPIVAIREVGCSAATNSRLALPHRRDTPLAIPFCGIAPNALDQRQQTVDNDAVHDSWLDVSVLASMRGLQ
jgi:hypothetical protein